LKIKERILEFIPEKMRDKIATENDAMEVESLKSFLQGVQHPVMERWVEEEEEEEDEVSGEYAPIQGVPMGNQSFMVPGVGGGPAFKIILNNVKIYAESVIIKKIEPKKKKKKK
jgi:acetyl-CoA decarbonylase/synthase complex subunit beta